MTLAPIESTEVEMREERVRIERAEAEEKADRRERGVCEVHARFSIGKSARVYVGFFTDNTANGVRVLPRVDEAAFVGGGAV